MSETGGLDIGMPDEGTGGVSEQASEQAQQRFAASQQAAQQQIKEEKKAKKRDDSVAQVIMQFLTDAQKAHLAVLIARMVSRDCPTTFILAVLSLINDRCTEVVHEYLHERQIDPDSVTPDKSVIPANSALTEVANERIAAWVARMDLVMRIDDEAILNALILDDTNIDGTILQLTTFVLQDFLTAQQKNVPFENLQQLSAGILQQLFQPYMHARTERRLAEAPTNDDDE